MTTPKLPVSTLQNLFHDSQNIDKSDMDLEQAHNIQTSAAIVGNFFGSGVLADSLIPNIIFNSDELTPVQAGLVSANNFDGTGLSVAKQPTDINLGNQLEVILTGSEVFGRLSTKVCIIGLSFNDDLIMDRMYFYRNGTKTTSQHYKRVLTILFNDFKGNNYCSANHGGTIIIQEAKPFQLSKRPITSSQDEQPNIFFRDFKVADPSKALYVTIQDGIGPQYNADSLKINITGQPSRTLESGDTLSRLGEKFLSHSDNIQKVTILLGVQPNDSASLTDRFNWSGDIIFSIHKLQTTVNCVNDIIPGLAIEFEPNPIALVELSFSQAELLSAGYLLTDVAQPVDFVVNGSSVSVPGGINKDQYYAFTIRRSGSAGNGTIFAEVGTDRTEDARLTLFSSGTWADVVEEDLWYQIWSDSVQIASGQGYDAGNGIAFTKTKTDPITGSEIDNQEKYFPFVTTGYSSLNTGVLKAVKFASIEEQDQKTGNQVYSRQQFVPEFSFVGAADLSTLKETSDPLIVGCIEDNNPKDNSTIIATQNFPGSAKGDKFTIIDPSPDLLSQQLLGSKLLPDYNFSNVGYLVAKVDVCIDGYGDVNGDGLITNEDLLLLSDLIGESIHYPSTQQKLVDGYFTLLNLLRADVNGDGYVSAQDYDLLQQFLNKEINAFPVGTSFTHIDLTVQNMVGRYDGYYSCDGYIDLDGYVLNPEEIDPTDALYYGNYLPSIIDSDAYYRAVPFVALEYRVVPQDFWQEYLLSGSSNARTVPSSYVKDTTGLLSCSVASPFTCEDSLERDPVACDPGQNIFFFPSDIVIAPGGQIKTPTGDFYKNDLEIATFILQMPETPLSEVSLNIFDKLLRDQGNGLTSAGFACARYADCSTVQAEDLALNRIRFDVAIQSFNKNLDGYDEIEGYGIVVDDTIGVYLDHGTGILKMTLSNNAADEIYMTMVTKIQIIAYLKKAGWNNQVQVITPDETQGLFLS